MMDERKTRAARIAVKVRKKQHMIAVANGECKADLVLKNASYVNVFSNEICQGDIAVAEGLVVGMGQYDGIEEIDVSGKIVVPGFVDAHIHLESSLVNPTSFAKAVIPHGTTTVITDPHEIANVCGTDGIDYMIDASNGLPVDVHFMLPSCVPSVPFEESGATLGWRDINAYFDHPRVLGLAEMMNYPGVTGGDRETIEKIVVSQAHHKKIDGHAPGLSGHSLDAYISAGVYSDHECDTAEDGLEKLRKGQFIMIREGTAAQNLEGLMPLLKPQYADRIMFCTDDKHPADLLEKGHIDYICRKAVALGADPILVVRTASYNAARYFQLNNKGAIAPGYLADFAVMDDLKDFRVRQVFKRGRMVYDNGRTIDVQEPEIDPWIRERVYNAVHMPEVTPERLAMQGAYPVIGLQKESIVTLNEGTADAIDVERDILKMAVAERHHNTGHIGLCYVHGYGLKRGAVATSIAHDSHNLIACGTNDEDMALAMNHVRAMKGGIVVADQGKVLAALPLVIGGLFSDRPLEEVNQLLEACKEAAYARGVTPGVDPFMTLSFASLPVIPFLRLTTLGVFDTEQQKFVK